MDIKLACTYQYSLTYRYGGRRGCEACGEEIPAASYICRTCKGWLHDSCAKKLLLLPQEIHHPLHSQHQLKYQQSDLNRHFFCDTCLFISAGSRYNCSSCNFNLDLACATSANDPIHEDGMKKTVQHYSHFDKLTLFKYRKTKEDDYKCIWCEKPLWDWDVCYGCIEHGFFVHEVCTNQIPRTLKHPSHPQHPLRLQYLDFTRYCDACAEVTLNTFSPCYVCQRCNFHLDFRCSKLFPTLKHKGHRHLLTFFEKTATDFQVWHFRCRLCRKLCDAGFYRCVQCSSQYWQPWEVNLHLQCFLVSSTVHKYHRHPLMLMNSVKEDDSGEYYCEVCEKERIPNHPVYCCKECTFIVHVECIFHKEEVAWSAPESMDSKALTVKEMEQDEGTDDIRSHESRHLILEHRMLYDATQDFGEKLYCNGCRLILTGPRYISENCNGFFLHEKCVKLPYAIQHPFHPTHPLYLEVDPMRSFGTDHYIICDECRDICFGFIYLCEGCKFKLDVKCAHTTVSQQKDIEMERATQLHHFNHPHKLILANSTDPIEQIECKICELSILGPAYLCRNPSCFRFVVHESCLGLPQKMQVPFHQDHMLVMSSKPYTEQSQCYACGLGFNDSGNRRHHSGYSCEQHCDLKLHTVCANSLRRPLKHESDSHWHNLYYLGTYCQLLFAKDRRVSTTISCSKCHANCRGRPFYRCLECAINFHLECVPMPRTIKSRCHIHHLVLKNSVVDDDSGEYYCDVCEEERFRDDHVYCCEQCSDRFAVHIECALAKVEEVQSYLDPLEMKESAIHEIVTSKSE